MISENFIDSFRIEIPGKKNKKGAQEDKMLMYLKSHGFNIRRDMKNCKLSSDDVKELILSGGISRLFHINKDRLAGKYPFHMKKLTFNHDQKSKNGKYRCILIVDATDETDKYVVPFHIFDKSNKKNVTSKELKKIKEIYKDLKG